MSKLKKVTATQYDEIQRDCFFIANFMKHVKLRLRETHGWIDDSNAMDDLQAAIEHLDFMQYLLYCEQMHQNIAQIQLETRTPLARGVLSDATDAGDKGGSADPF